MTQQMAGGVLPEVDACINEARRLGRFALMVGAGSGRGIFPLGASAVVGRYKLHSCRRVARHIALGNLIISIVANSRRWSKRLAHGPQGKF